MLQTLVNTSLPGSTDRSMLASQWPLLALISFFCLVGGCGGQTTARVSDAAAPVDLRVVFGSCADDDKPNHPVWDAMFAAQPDLMIMMGDNVYADSDEFVIAPSAALMQAEYAKLAASKGFARLRDNVPVLATWDDHDYGLNDGGREFAFKDTAAQIFLDFWRVPLTHPARQRPGVYMAQRFHLGGIDLQVLLLDTRSFRDPLVSRPLTAACSVKNFGPNYQGTLLGDAQWQWLAEQLAEPADLRLLVSSIQLLPAEHCWEKWANFPAERARLFALIRASRVRNLVVLSGDRHLGELSALPASDASDLGFELHEATSSPLSARSGFGAGERNALRLGTDNLRVSQFGVLEVAAGELRLQLRDASGAIRIEHVMPLESSLISVDED